MRKYIKLIPAVAILIIGISGTLFIQKINTDNNEAVISGKINQKIDNDVLLINQELSTGFTSMEILRVLFEKNPMISRDEFEHYAAPILERTSALMAISWVPKIMESELSEFEHRMKAFHSQIQISQINQLNEQVFARSKPFYFPVEYIEPKHDNFSALGFDIYSESMRRATINEAIVNDRLMITPPIKLVQDTVGYGFLGIIPVYKTNQVIADHQNVDHINGLITAVFKVDRLINEALYKKNNAEEVLLIYDTTNRLNKCVYGDEKSIPKNYTVYKKQLIVGYRNWEFVFFIDEQRKIKQSDNSILISGFSITLLLFVIGLFPFIKFFRTYKLIQKLEIVKKDQLKTEQSLVESKQYNRILFTESTIGLALTQMDGKLIDINPSFASIIGRTIEETLQLSYWDITPKKYNQQELQQLENLEQTGHYGPYEKEYIHRNGHLVPVRLQGKIIERKGVKYIWSSVEDISIQKKAEENIVSAENKFKALVEQSLTGIYIFEKNRFVYVNKRFCEIFGYSENEILEQMKPTDVITLEDRQRANENINKRLSGEVESVRYIAKGNHRTGKLLWVEIHGTHLEIDGKDVITGTVLDITERKSSEDQIRKLNEELEKRVMERTSDLEAKISEIQRMNKLFIGRELRMKELKEKIKELESRQKY